MNEQPTSVLSVAGATLTFNAASEGALHPAATAITRITAARELCAPAAIFRHHPLATFAIVLTHRGKAEVVCGDACFAHEPRTLILMRPDADIEERVGLDAPWDTTYILLSGTWADWCAREMWADILAIANSPQRCGELMQNILDAALDGEKSLWRVTASIAELLGIIEIGIQPAEDDEMLEARVVRIVDASPNEMLGRDQIAAKLGLTTRALAHRFQKESGYALAHWLRERRVERARKLLSQGRTVASVADALGFANPFHFSRVFKRMTGQLPSEVRAAAFRERLHS